MKPSFAHTLLGWSNVLALLALVVAASLLSPYFLDLRNIMNVLRGASVLCIVAAELEVGIGAAAVAFIGAASGS